MLADKEYAQFSQVTLALWDRLELGGKGGYLGNMSLF